MTTKAGLTQEQHNAIGLELAKMQDTVNTMISTVGHAYRSNCRQVKAMERIGKAIENARSVMEVTPDNDLTEAYYPDGHSTAYTRWSA